MEWIKKLLFGDPKLFVIFKNPDYDRCYSIKHRRGYIYINPPQFGGAGISYRRDMCAAHPTTGGAIDCIKKFIQMKYNNDFSEFKIVYQL